MKEAARPYLSAADRPELPALTGLRAVAALWVVSWHASAYLPTLPFPVSRGYLGVDLFFVLSGFVISYVYWSEFEPGGRRRYARFLALRVARLWPAHVTMVLVVLAIAVASALWITPEKVQDWPRLLGEVPLHALLIHNWGFVADTKLNFPSWSVSAEFFVYVLFPLYVLLFRGIAGAIGLTAAIVLAMALCWLGMSVLFDVPLGTSGRVGQIRVVCEFAVGVALFRLWRAPALSALPWTAIALASIGGIVAVGLLADRRSDYLLILLMAPLILALARRDGGAARLMALRPVVYLGEISYSVYLVHAPAVQAADWTLRRLDAAPQASAALGWAFMAASMALSLAGGALLFHIVEKPARFWLRARIDRIWPAAAK